MSDVAARASDRPGPADATALLLARSAAGDTEAFAELYDVVASRVHGLVLRVVRDAREAEEVTIAVFLEVWRTARTHAAARESAMSWILAIAHRRAVDRARSTSADRPAEDDSELLAGARAARPDLEQQALELAYLDGLTHVEVSRRMDASLGATAARIRGALVALRGEVRRGGPTARGAHAGG